MWAQRQPARDLTLRVSAREQAKNLELAVGENAAFR